VLSNIWIAPNGDVANANQIRSGGHNLEGVGSLAWTPDGRIVYSSLASGTQDLWIINSDGSGQKQVTAESGNNFEAAVTPDGRYIVYTSAREDGHNIWRMDPDGANPMQLTRGNIDDDADVSADSQWVIYDSRSSGDWNVWKVSIDGGDPVQLTDFTSREVRVSPDGKLIACEYRENINSPWRYAIFPFEGGKPIQVFDLAGKDKFAWSRDSRSIIYNHTIGGVGNIWSLPLGGGSPKQLTNFKTEQIYNFDWSADGKKLVLARGTTTIDVVLIKDIW
jgi:TolB protein